MVFAIMIPSFVLAIVPDFIVPNVYGIISVVTLVMAVAGALAVSLGVWLVASWRFQDLKGCFKKKRIMLSTMALWLVSLSFGIVLVHYSLLGCSSELKVNYLRRYGLLCYF